MGKIKHKPIQQHTPGPWEVASKDCVYASGRLICDCQHTGHAGKPGIDPEDVANANLIACVPDMLELIKQVAAGNSEYGSLQLKAHQMVENITGVIRSFTGSRKGTS